MLSVTHDCFEGGYMGFMRLRLALASAALGTTLEVTDIYQLFERAPPNAAREARWVRLRAEWPALAVLLDHSDCEGEIAVDEQLPMAEEIDRAVALMGPDLVPMSFGAEKFAAGLRRAHAAGERVVFR